MNANNAQQLIRLRDGLSLRRLGDGKTENVPNLIMFPFVGGYSLSFAPLAKALNGCFRCWAVDPPGHGWTKGELFTDFNQLLRLYYEQLGSVFVGRYFLFGHSLGGLFAYQLGKWLERDGNPPAAVFVSASPVPHRISEYQYLRNKNDLEIMEVLAQYGGIAETLMQNTEFLRHAAKPVQADVKVFLSTEIKRQPVLMSPLIVLFSKGDAFIKDDEFFEWDIYGQNVSYEEVSGNHLFIQSEYMAVADTILKYRTSSLH